MTTATRPETVLNLVLRGGNREIFDAREPEVLAEAPAGTGKTRTWLELLNLLCWTYKPLRVLMLRKIQATMPSSCIAEFKQHVLHPGEGVYFYGGSKDEPAAFRYPNGSIIAVAGLDNAEKVLSSFWDIIYVNEATDLTLEDWETLTTRLRGAGPDHRPTADDGTVFVHRRLCADCNPTYATHWLMQRTDHGTTRLIRSKLEDNPAYYNEDGTPTEEGADYIIKLDRLTGIRYERFRLGKRVGVQDAIYPFFNRDVHMRPLEEGVFFKATIIGEDYGTDHLCAVVALGIDQFNRRWVREVWAEADHDQGKSLNRVVSEFKAKYNTRRGRVDPNQAYLAGQHGFNVAKGGNGGADGPPRLHRIDLVEPLFYNYAGGWVPSFSEEKRLEEPVQMREGNDTPGFFIVMGCPGGEDLANEVEAYHYTWTITERGKSKGVYRVNENRIAAVEYANEEWEEGEHQDYAAAGKPVAHEVKYAFAEETRRSPFSKGRAAPRETTVRVG